MSSPGALLINTFESTAHLSLLGRIGHDGDFCCLSTSAPVCYFCIVSSEDIGKNCCCGLDGVKYWCHDDCFNAPMLCKTCILDTHRHLPFHRVRCAIIISTMLCANN